MRITLSFLGVISILALGVNGLECERLKASLTYTQEEAPRDLSGVLPVVVERVNRVLQGVVDVEVEWTGADLHGHVGEHIVQCRVTRLASVVGREQDGYKDEEGRLVTTQCFHVPFSILDTNECTLPREHPMRHHCHESAVCVNTNGSYECICPSMDHHESLPETADNAFWKRLSAQERTPWEVSFNRTSRTSCPSMPSTHGCCPELVHIKDGAQHCRARFRCPVDPCASAATNDCATSARCVRKASPVADPNYECQCPSGLMGNGHRCRPGIDPTPEPRLMYDGKTPTEETIKNNYYCDCTKPIIDACSGFPPCKGKHEICTVSSSNQPHCVCKPGYIKHGKYGCVDEKPPLLRLRHDPNGDGILRLMQGDVYQEYLVDIQDENAEEYMRSLKIAYSKPLPSGCLTKIGEFHVNYTIATPWTTPSFVRVTRRVIIEDIDECSIDATVFAKTCPELIPQCDIDSGAICVNTIGSYTCKCPEYTTGDGFKKGLTFGEGDTPESFKGGTGCVDTSKPVITLEGPNPKIFRVCECGGIQGIMGGSIEKLRDTNLKIEQAKYFGDDIKELIRSTAGAELCATSSYRNPRPSDCVKAYDHTFRGKIDLSQKVVVGEPYLKAPLHWAVPYDVEDEAGNKAQTVVRDIIVENVVVEDLEAKIRQQIMQEQDAELRKAIAAAVEQDRKQRNTSSGRQRKGGSSTTGSCPDCPKCDCSGAFDASMCNSVCAAKIESCAIDEHSFALRLFLFLERFMPSWLVPIVLVLFFGYSFFLMLFSILRLAFNAQSLAPDASQSEERERALRGAVTYYNNGNVASSLGSISAPGASPSYGAPPRKSMSLGSSEPSFFTPSSGQAALRSPSDHTDIYLTSDSIISPSMRGDGVRKRSPYPYNERR